LYQQGVFLVGIAYIDGRLVLRLLIANPQADRSAVDDFFKEVVNTGRRLQQEWPLE
jgi:hypothetical protein